MGESFTPCFLVVLIMLTGYKNADALVASEFAKAYRELLAAYGMRVVDSDIVEHEALAFVVVERYAVPLC